MTSRIDVEAACARFLSTLEGCEDGAVVAILAALDECDLKFPRLQKAAQEWVDLIDAEYDEVVFEENALELRSAANEVVQGRGSEPVNDTTQCAAFSNDGGTFATGDVAFDDAWKLLGEQVKAALDRTQDERALIDLELSANGEVRNTWCFSPRHGGGA